MEEPDELTTVTIYTDGSCQNNGESTARAGSGVWYSNGDDRNVAKRVNKCLPQTNNSGELLAVHQAATMHKGWETLVIKTDSLYVIRTLTKRAQKLEDTNYLYDRAEDLTRTTIDLLTKRPGVTIFQWVKGHAGILGNVGADTLAAAGAKLAEERSNLEPGPPRKKQGMKLARLTQRDIYNALTLQEVKWKRNTTKDNIKATQATTEALWGHSPEERRIWKNILDNRNFTKQARAFLWKAMHEIHKCGPYWHKMGNPENRAECSMCGEEESLDHILFRCNESPCRQVWARARAMTERKTREWPRDLDIYTVMGIGFIRIKNDQGKRLKGTERLLQIVITEAAHTIWKLRCKRKFDRTEDETEIRTTEEQAISELARQLNARLGEDRARTNRFKFGKAALSQRTVVNTWSGALRDEQSLPEDWLSFHKGVLVGITPQRANGRNR